MPAPARPAATALHRDLAQAIVEALRGENRRPGDEIAQLALARRLGVSRTPVRGAMAMLARFGVVSIEGRRTILRDLDARMPARGARPDPVDSLVVEIARARMRGELPDAISENDLQRRFDVGRRDLAHALRRLAELGILARRRGHGWAFTPGLASPADRAAAYRFRSVVEPAALLQPGYALPPGFVAAMQARHREFLDRPWRESDAVAFFEMNAEFHLGITAGSGNRFFIAAADQHNRLRRLLNYDWNLGEARMRVSCTEHLGVLDALARGDQPLAAERLAGHLAGTAALGTQLARLRARRR